MRTWVLVLVGVWAGAGSALAEPTAGEEEASRAETVEPAAEYPALTRGRVVVVNAQRLVVAQEPKPLATLDEAPPEPVEKSGDQPPAPCEGAIWVAGHWVYGASGFAWVAGRYVAPRRGHVFVPPRWAFLEDQYFYFTGFYVPYGVYVRSHFNRYYYSGTPDERTRGAHGPYWPIGAPATASTARASVRARDPYWPIGAGR